MSTHVSGTNVRGYPHSVLEAVSKAYTASMYGSIGRVATRAARNSSS